MDSGLEDIYDLLIRKGYPFCFYVLPDSRDVKVVAQLDNNTLLTEENFDRNESGFFYRGFQPSESVHRIKPDFAGRTKDFPWEIFQNIDYNNIKPPECKQQHEIGRAEYLTNLSKLINAINRGEAEKVVYTRIKSINHDKSPVAFFQYLTDNHHHAFRYLLKTSGGQLWFGASPEIILRKKGALYNTVALAGTVSNEEKHNLFEEKNKDEQHIVSQYITAVISAIGGKNIELSESFASKASNVSHIKTNISFEIDDSSLIRMYDLSEALHPTPAVGGTPLQSSLELIDQLESHDRRFYAGYLGPYNLLKESTFFVNIRCAQYFEKKVLMYVGGGITKNSIPEKEWEETELKAELILDLIRNA